MAEKKKHSDAFGAVLSIYRLEKGLAQEQLSERVDVVLSFICTLESGKKQPSLNMILRLASMGNKTGFARIIWSLNVYRDCVPRCVPLRFFVSLCTTNSLISLSSVGLQNGFHSVNRD
ncbi:MAG: helix-turn-helix domain-containing protein [Desulfovibrio sp.]|jgi:DNA-binding XRE family transcriptional regulator|nr:helix-turn-helix domain-containing protein [Desulfovibrio sp.]